jgi:hypothetical protein
MIYSYVLNWSLNLANGLAQPEPGQARPFGDVARHGIKTKWAVPWRPTRPKAKPKHGPIAFKRVVSGWVEARIYEICLFFS